MTAALGHCTWCQQCFKLNADILRNMLMFYPLVMQISTKYEELSAL